MSAIASRITSFTTVYLIVYSRADQRKHQSSASLAFVRGIHRRPVNSPHKGPVTRKMVPFDDVIMNGNKIRTTMCRLTTRTRGPGQGLSTITRPLFKLIFKNCLTHLPLDKMASISQLILWDAFAWVTSFVFWLKFHWSLFLIVQLTMSQYWFR